MTFRLSRRSRRKLAGVHPDIVRVVERAIQHTDVDFAVMEGVRSAERQLALWRQGASRLNGIPRGEEVDGLMGTGVSRHQTGHAVDVAAWVAGGVRWDWPLYHRIAAAFKRAADMQGVRIVWGGDWKSFPDGPHFELSRSH